MSALDIVPATTDTQLADWRRIHNAIIPAHELSIEDVRERAARNWLAVAYLDGTPVGCATTREPDAEGATTVIARILPPHRNRGLGEQLYYRALAEAEARGAGVIETVVLADNTAGLRFALRHGFTELERYTLPGDEAEWIDLRLTRE